MIDAPRIQELIRKVPTPPEDPLPHGISDGECDEFEKRTGITLPEDVRDWLRVVDGTCAGPGGLCGICPYRKHLAFESLFSMFPSWKVRKWIPIAGDGCGNYYVIPTQHDYGHGFPVVFVDTSRSTDQGTYIVASDISHFIVALLEKELGKEGWPFNKNAVIEFDPHITAFKGVDLPWAAR